MEVLFRDAVETAEVAFGLVPKILDPVDMVAVFREGFRVTGVIGLLRPDLNPAR